MLIGRVSCLVLLHRTDVFDAAYYSTEGILLNEYIGWGLNAPNFKLVPRTKWVMGVIGLKHYEGICSVCLPYREWGLIGAICVYWQLQARAAHQVGDQKLPAALNAC